MTVRVKICGVRHRADLDACLAAGADLIGFNFWPGSKRFIQPTDAATLVALVPPPVIAVGVFVAAAPEEVTRAVAASGVKAVQLHGDEDPARYSAVPADIIQVLRVGDEGVGFTAVVPDGVRYVLLDSKVEGYGGAGTRFDWSLVPGIAARLRLPLLLAGGLTPDNVAEAVRVARPWGVDVASGVESAPGVKDAAKIRAFVMAARGAGGSP